MFYPGDIVTASYPSPCPPWWSSTHENVVENAHLLTIITYASYDDTYKCTDTVTGKELWFPASCLSKSIPTKPESPQDRIIRLRNEFRKQYGGTR